MSDHQNKVLRVGVYGGDLEHASSAWTSTSRELTEEKRRRIPGLLKQLAENGHHTPFEKSALHFLVTSDIASHIHIIKHRIGVSVNAESARYKELRQDRFYVPDDWPVAEKLALTEHMERSFELYHQLVEQLTNDLCHSEVKFMIPHDREVELKAARKRAKESARFALPYATQITSDVMFNFRSFMHFVGLRADHHAQREIRQIAAWMLLLVSGTQAFDASLEAFGWTRKRIVEIAEEVEVQPEMPKEAGEP